MDEQLHERPQEPDLLDQLRRVSEYYEVPINRLVEFAVGNLLATAKRLDGRDLDAAIFPIPAGRRIKD